MTKIVELNEYQRRALETWINRSQCDRGYSIIYPTLGLCGESGEVDEKIKKLLRDHSGVLDDEMKQAIALELGDVFWYLSTLSY